MKELVSFDIAAMTKLGEEMRTVSDQYPDDDKPQYSTTEVEAVENAARQVREKVPRNGEWLAEVGLARAIRYDRGVISVCLTTETFVDPPVYRLSMCYITGPSRFGPVPAVDAALVAFCILGEGTEAVPNPSGIESAKHFIKRKA
jgi:hypothetical protein